MQNKIMDVVGLKLDRRSADPINRQIYTQMRQMVLDGRLQAGTKIPSSRALADKLDCSRMTTATAYDMLATEGYLVGRIGSGTYVSDILPDDLLTRRADPGRRAGIAPIKLSKRGRRLAASVPDWATHSNIFAPGVPSTHQFPFGLWARIFGRVWREPSDRLMAKTEAAGYRPLREAIAQYLAAHRGLACTADEIVITSGTTNALDIIARTLMDEGDTAWVEDPGYPDVIHSLSASGVHCEAVPVDEEGIDVEAGIRRAASARLAWVTPSHQWPMGSILSLRRRLALIEWAGEADALIVEDDYDSEFRYSGMPLASLRSLDEAGRVLYLGSFSKVCFPALRLGYLVVPEQLAQDIVRARLPLDYHTALPLQPVMAEFIAGGHYEAHIRRMRKLYHERQQAMIEAIGARLGDLLIVRPDEAGMSLIAEFTPELASRMTDAEAAERGRRHGLTLAPLSSFCVSQPPFPALVLGYSALSLPEIRAGVQCLETALRRTG